MTTPVNFPLAKLLKEKGFEQNPMKYVNQATMEGTLVFPTIADVIMWLYEKHGVWISADFKETDESFQYCCRLIHCDNLPRIFCNDGFNSPTEAYEAAIEYVLNNLI